MTKDQFEEQIKNVIDDAVLHLKSCGVSEVDAISEIERTVNQILTGKLKAINE